MPSQTSPSCCIQAVDLSPTLRDEAVAWVDDVLLARQRLVIDPSGAQQPLHLGPAYDGEPVMGTLTAIPRAGVRRSHASALVPF